MKGFYLAFDLGTSGAKAVLFSQNGTMMDKEFYPYKTDYPKAGWAEQNPNEWYKAVCNASRVLVQRNQASKQIAAISFSGQTMGCVCVDSNGRALRSALIHCDQRSTQQARRLSETIGLQRLYDLTGTRLSPSYPIEKLMWVKDNEPEIYERTYKMIGPKDYLVSRLCGRIATEYTEASMSGCFLLKEMAWSQEVLDAVAINMDKLPEILDPNDVAGALSHKAAEDMGVQAGTPVVMGGADGQCGCLGIAGADTPHAYGYLGSAAVAYASSPDLVLNGNPNLVTINCNAIKGLYRYYSTMQTAGISFTWLRSLLSRDYGAPIPYDALNGYAQEGKGALDGLFFLPYLLGERSPYWNAHAKGAFVGITPAHGAGDFVRAVMDGVALNFAINYKEIMKNNPKDDIILYGGCAKSKIWRQIFSDILNTPVYVSEISEEAATYGAMLLASAAVGVDRISDYKVNCKLAAVPSAQAHRRYSEAAIIFQDAYASLCETFECISAFVH